MIGIIPMKFGSWLTVTRDIKENEIKYEKATNEDILDTLTVFVNSLVSFVTQKKRNPVKRIPLSLPVYFTNTYPKKLRPLTNITISQIVVGFNTASGSITSFGSSGSIMIVMIASFIIARMSSLLILPTNLRS